MGGDSPNRSLHADQDARLLVHFLGKLRKWLVSVGKSVTQVTVSGNVGALGTGVMSGLAAGRRTGLRFDSR